MSQQTTYAVPALGYPGMLMGSGHKKHSVVNDLGATRQLDTMVIDTAVDETEYSFTVDGIEVAYTSGVSATIAEIRDGLIEAGRAIGALDGVVVFQPSGDDVTIIAAVPGEGFTSAESDDNLTRTATVSNTSTEAIPFGRAVVKRSGTDQSVKLPSTGSERFMGVAVREHGMVDVASAADEIKPFSVFTAVYSGDVVVEVEEAVAVGDAVYFRHTASGAEKYGVFRNDADTADADAISGAKFMSSTTGPGLAILRLP